MVLLLVVSFIKQEIQHSVRKNVFVCSAADVCLLSIFQLIMNKLEPPQAFSFECNVSHSWKLWLKHYDFYLTATEKDTKGDKIKIYILLTWIGQKGREIYETFAFEPGDKMKLSPVLHKYSEFCNPRKNITILRHTFLTYRQQEGQNLYDLWLN